MRKVANLFRDARRIRAYGRYYALKWVRSLCERCGCVEGFDRWRAERCMPRRGMPFNCASRLFQVVGVPRSGTTLLAALLDNHPSAMCLIEPFLGYLKAGSFRMSSGDGGRSTVFRDPVAFINARLGATDGHHRLGFKETFRLRGEKLLRNVGFLRNNLGNGVQTLAIVRDPRAVWCSILERRGASHGEEPHPSFAEEWNELIDWVREEKIFYVRYEDLVTDPEAQVKRVYAELGLGFAKHLLELPPKHGHGDKRAQVGGHIRDGSLGKYRRLPAGVLRSIEAACAENMERMGYRIDQIDQAKGIDEAEEIDQADEVDSVD